MIKRYLLALLLVAVLAATVYGAMRTFGSGEEQPAAISSPTAVPSAAATANPTTPPATPAPVDIPSPTASPTETPVTRQYRVGLQIGHYKIKEVPDELSEIRKQWGTYGGGRNEDEIAMDVATRTAALLQKEGVLVDLLPSTVLGGYTADAFVSLHADGASSPAKRGYKIATRYASYVAEQDAMLVEMLYDKYGAATGLPLNFEINDNMRDYYTFAPWRSNWRVSNYTPSALIEMGYMTHPADREVLFDATDNVAAGLAAGIMQFLNAAYGESVTSRPYGYGKADSGIRDGPAAPTPLPTPKQEEGNWQIVLSGSQPEVNVYRESGGGGGVIAKLPRGQVLPTTLRKGNFYRIALPDGTPGWVHVNLTVVKL